MRPFFSLALVSALWASPLGLVWGACELLQKYPPRESDAQRGFAAEFSVTPSGEGVAP